MYSRYKIYEKRKLDITDWFDSVLFHFIIFLYGHQQGFNLLK